MPRQQNTFQPNSPGAKIWGREASQVTSGVPLSVVVSDCWLVFMAQIDVLANEPDGARTWDWADGFKITL